MPKHRNKITNSKRQASEFRAFSVSFVYFMTACKFLEKMNLIILLCIPLVPAIIVTIYAVVTNKKEIRHTEPKTA